MCHSKNVKGMVEPKIPLRPDWTYDQTLGGMHPFPINQLGPLSHSLKPMVRL